MDITQTSNNTKEILDRICDGKGRAVEEYLADRTVSAKGAQPLERILSWSRGRGKTAEPEEGSSAVVRVPPDWGNEETGGVRRPGELRPALLEITPVQTRFSAAAQRYSKFLKVVPACKVLDRSASSRDSGLALPLPGELRLLERCTAVALAFVIVVLLILRRHRGVLEKEQCTKPHEAVANSKKDSLSCTRTHATHIGLTW